MENLFDLCIHHLFERQVSKTPDKIALILQERKLTYAEINEQANQIAAALVGLGVGIETPVGICLRRSPEAVAAILGILKAGGAYVPIDPDFPESRKRYILEDSGCGVLLTEDALLSALPPFAGRILLVDVTTQPPHPNPPQIGEGIVTTPPPIWGRMGGGEQDGSLWQQERSNPDVPITPDALLYILYTSGSTGTPKGVCGIHRSAVNRCIWMWEQYPFHENEVCCHKTTLSFVDSVWEIFGPLLAGVEVVILPHAASANPQAMVDLLRTAKVTRIILVPSLLQTLLNNRPALGDDLPDLKIWTVSGEQLTQNLLQKFQASVPDGVLLNLYGSTEVAGDVTWAEFAGESANLTSGVPIGQPILNAEVHILDEELQPIAPGQIGELWVGGGVLARGYHKKPHETSARFIPNPFSGRGTLFKTGDLVTRDDNGLFYYVGRVDNQVKIRGFRVELEEVERVLAQFHPEISSVTALLQTDALLPETKQLVAFVVPSGIDVEAMKQYALTALPYYMLPARIIALDELPLTPNGKIDRQVLSGMVGWRFRVIDAEKLPQTATEKLLADIWQPLFRVSPLSTDDDFFDLGGDSLSVVALLEKLKREWGAQIPLSDFLNQPSLASLASLFDKYKQIERLPVGDVRFPGVEIVPFEQRYAAQTANLISDSFATKGPLELALGVKKEEYAIFADEVCRKSLTAALSYIALDTLSGNVVGFCLCEDFVDYLTYQFEIAVSMNPIFALLDSLDQAYIENYKQMKGDVKVGEVFHLFLSGASAQVEGAALLLALENKALERAASLHYQRVVTTCTHSVTIYIAQELGFQRKYALPFGSFEYEGRHVFADISAHHQEAVLFEKVLENPS